jgi:hypothetical protein
LELYGSAFLAQHRAEILQNFENLEHTSSSKAALWLLMGKDFMLSHHLAQYPQVTLGKDRSDVHRPRHRACRFAGIYIAALFPGSRNGLLWIRDRMVRGMDGEASGDESISSTMCGQWSALE